MKALRIVIERITIRNRTQARANPTEAEQTTANKSFDKFIIGQSKAGDTAGNNMMLTNFTIVQPTLLLDQVIDEGASKKSRTLLSHM